MQDSLENVRSCYSYSDFDPSEILSEAVPKFPCIQYTCLLFNAVQWSQQVVEMSGEKLK